MRPLGRIRVLDALDKRLVNVGETVLGRHSKERRKRCKFRNLVHWRESVRRSTGQLAIITWRGGEAYPGV